MLLHWLNPPGGQQHALSEAGVAFNSSIRSKHIWAVSYQYKLDNYRDGPLFYNHCSSKASHEGGLFPSNPPCGLWLVIYYPTIVKPLGPNCPQFCWPLLL